jgi:hypothetical protein
MTCFSSIWGKTQPTIGVVDGKVDAGFPSDAEILVSRGTGKSAFMVHVHVSKYFE